MNHKRVYRVMRDAELLLPKAPKLARSSRRHEGTVADGSAIRVDVVCRRRWPPLHEG
jgi:hypothetical protein